MTEKQRECIKRLRSTYGDEMLIKYASFGKWKGHFFDLDNLSKEEAQRIITSAPHKPIKAYSTISMVQSL